MTIAASRSKKIISIVKLLHIRIFLYGAIVGLAWFIWRYDAGTGYARMERALEQAYTGPGDKQAWTAKAEDELYYQQLVEETIELKKNYTFLQTSRTRTYIQKSGAKDKDIGELEVNYNTNYEKLITVDARTIQPDGKKLKYDKKQDMEPYYEEPLYSSSRVVMLSMPKVVPGNILELYFKSKCFKPHMKDAFSYRVFFNDLAPVKRQVFHLIVPNDMNVHIQYLNMDIEPTVTEHGQKKEYTWERWYIDKFEEEDSMPDRINIEPILLISTVPDWDTVAQWYWEKTAQNIVISDEMREKVAELTSALKTKEEKIQAIIEYIRDEMRYVSMGFGEHNFEPHRSDELFDSKYGDCKDQTIIAMAMLKILGVETSICLHRDQDYGAVADKLSMPWYYDHAILGVHYNDTIHYCDVLIKGYRFNELHRPLEGGHLFVINKDRGFHTRLPIVPADDCVFRERKTIRLFPDGSAKVDVYNEYPRYVSEYLREDWQKMTKKQKRENMEKWAAKSTEGGTVKDHTFIDIDKKYGIVKKRLKFKDPQFAEIAGKYMIFGRGAEDRDESFTSSEREYSILMRINRTNEKITTYIIPEGYTVGHIPSAITIKKPFEEFTRQYTRKGNTIVETQRTIEKRIRLPLKEYKAIRAYYDTIPKVTKERIVIVRE